ncbi:helix-turn-helix domain-containing protein [Enterococcus faecium]
MFLDKYIESSVLRKITIIKTIYTKKNVGLDCLAKNLNVSLATIKNDLKCIQLNLDTEQVLIKIVNNTMFFNVHVSEDYLEKILCTIYGQSMFLKLLSYYFQNNESQEKYIYDNFFISKSKYYAERKKIICFLKDVNLKLTKNQIIGDSFKILWVRSCVDYFYRLNTINIDDIKSEEIRDFIVKISNSRYCYYTDEQKELLLRLLILLSDKDKKNFENTDIFSRFQFIQIPECLQLSVLELVKKDFFYDSRITDCVLFCLFLLNNHEFSPQISNIQKKWLATTILKNVYVKDLIERIEIHFSVEIFENNILLGSLYRQLKQYGLKDYIVLVNHCSYMKHQKYINEKKELEKIFIEWNNENELNLEINLYDLGKLAHDIIEYKPIKKNKKVYIYTDSWDIYLLAYVKIKKNLKVKIDLVDFWINDSCIRDRLAENIIIKIGGGGSYNISNEIYIDDIYFSNINWEEINYILLEYLTSK